MYIYLAEKDYNCMVPLKWQERKIVKTLDYILQNKEL